MKSREHAHEIITRLQTEYPSFETALDYQEPWQLVVAVALSAQTTDENVNNVTKDLFKKYPTPQAIADAPIQELEQAVYSTGYYKSKARNINKLCTDLVERFNSEVPETLKELTSLAGVGRKTANVVLHVLYDKAEGIVMDTHIARLTHRLGFTKKKSPRKGEQVMMQVLEKQYWREWGDLLIQHGREVCTARKPACSECVLADICPSAHQFEDKQS